MAEIQRKNLRAPDETVTFPLGVSREVHLGELTVSHNSHEPGWRWSEHVRPVVGGESCRVHHTGLVLRGRGRARLDDGTEVELSPGDVFDVPPGHDGWVVGDEPYETIDWVGGHRWASPPAGDRVLATILFTDIVDSTARASELGDRAWGMLLEQHHAIVRRILDRHGGREVATTGDGILAIFDGAERALRSASTIAGATADAGVQVRVGVHTGEVEIVPGNVRGMAVHVASRVMSAASPGEAWVSGTTHDLVEGTDIRFDERGTHQLKGVAGARQLYALVP